MRVLRSRPCLAIFLHNSISSRHISPAVGLSAKYYSQSSTFHYCKTRLFAKSAPMGITSFPPIVDVDCNLWHCDVKSLQNKQDDDDSTNISAWNMLEEDAIAKANIVAMLSPSSTIDEARKGLELLQRAQQPPPVPIKTTVGVHPYHVNDKELQGKTLVEHQETMTSLLQNADNTPWIAAVGECGLDASEGFPALEDQLPWFKMQIQVAQSLNSPLFVHERLAFDETMRLLQDVTTVPVIIHCFTGTKEECAAYIQRGYSVSVSGFILKESNDNCEQVLSCLREGIIPLDKLMIETDAPYMGFEGCRQLYLEHNQDFVASLNSKKRKRLSQSIYPNVPSSLPMVLQKVTECLQEHDSSLTLEAVAEATTKNAQSFFGLSANTSR